jgi:hypothetical protein
MEKNIAVCKKGKSSIAAKWSVCVCERVRVEVGVEVKQVRRGKVAESGRREETSVVCAEGPFG